MVHYDNPYVDHLLKNNSIIIYWTDRLSDVSRDPAQKDIILMYSASLYVSQVVAIINLEIYTANKLRTYIQIHMHRIAQFFDKENIDGCTSLKILNGTNLLIFSPAKFLHRTVNLQTWFN